MASTFLAEPIFPSSFRRDFDAFPAAPLLSATPPKLPSLEGILKRLHQEHHRQLVDLSDSGASTDDESVASSVMSSPSRAMPSLRSILSPALLEPQQLQQHQHAAWDESCASDASSEYDCAMGSPSSTLATKKPSSGPQRSRASKYCKIEGCERVSQRNNLCHSHGGKRLCKEDGCVSKDRGNGFCIKHGGGKICSIGGCDKKARRKGLCTQHFRVCDSLALGSAPYA